MPTHDQKSDTLTRELNSQALALAEQLGRIAGTLEGTAEAWLNRATVTDQLTKVRDSATQLLNSLSAGTATGRKAAEAITGKIASKIKLKKPSAKAAAPNRSTRRTAGADLAHAPGKKHRKPAESVRGAKHSDSTIPKAKASAAARQRRKSYA